MTNRLVQTLIDKTQDCKLKWYAVHVDFPDDIYEGDHLYSKSFKCSLPDGKDIIFQAIFYFSDDSTDCYYIFSSDDSSTKQIVKVEEISDTFHLCDKLYEILSNKNYQDINDITELISEIEAL